jgi:lysozyme
MSDEGRRMLIALEGSRARIYRDPAGLPTIGVGHLLTPSELTSGKIRIGDKDVKYVFGLSDRQIDDLLAQDLDDAEWCVRGGVEGVALEQHEFDALVSFVFNVGCQAFHNSTLARRLNSGDKGSTPEQLRRWVYSGGEVLDGLRHRREVEIDHWRGGPTGVA